MLVLAVGTFGGVEIYGRSLGAAFAVAVVILAVMGLIIVNGKRR